MYLKQYDQTVDTLCTSPLSNILNVHKIVISLSFRFSSVMKSTRSSKLCLQN